MISNDSNCLCHFCPNCDLPIKSAGCVTDGGDCAVVFECVCGAMWSRNIDDWVESVRRSVLRYMGILVND